MPGDNHKPSFLSERLFTDNEAGRTGGQAGSEQTFMTMKECLVLLLGAEYCNFHGVSIASCGMIIYSHYNVRCIFSGYYSPSEIAADK